MGEAYIIFQACLNWKGGLEIIQPFNKRPNTV